MIRAEHRKWIILALLFLATAINYVDRQTLSILAPVLRQEFHLSEFTYANIVTAFLIPYTIMYALGGRLMDKLGSKKGLGVALGMWSVATMLTSLARGASSLGFFRSLLGLAEPCVFPAGIRACAEWFGSRQRAVATGVFSSGSAVGAVIAAPLIAVCTLSLGWRWAFLLPGLLGFLWVPFWWIFYKDHGPFETPGNQKDSSDDTWHALLHKRQVWALVLPRLASDPVWYFYLFWLPDYLQHERHLSLQEIGFYGWIPFLFADIGSVAGGAWSDALVRRGRSPSSARIFVLVVVGCLAPLGAVVGIVPSATAAVTITCAIAFLTQCWSINTAALASDVFPSSSVGSVTGMMGTAGSLGGILFAQILGVLIVHVGYAAAFVVAAMLHPAATVTLLVFLKRKRTRQDQPIPV